MKQMESRIKRGVLFVPIFIGGLFLFTLFIQLLWNGVLTSVVPAIKTVSYWQAMGILALSKLLFGFNMGGRSRRHWKQKMEEKWHHMSPEERERLKAEWKNRCGSRWSMGSKPDDGSAMAAGQGLS
jgi:hypothetical protein